jgi:hypothetical protein
LFSLTARGGGGKVVNIKSQMMMDRSAEGGGLKILKVEVVAREKRDGEVWWVGCSRPRGRRV